jgi:hypothetical protein
MFKENEIVGFKKFKDGNIALAKVVSCDEKNVVLSVLSKYSFITAELTTEVVAIGDSTHERVFRIPDHMIDSLVEAAIKKINGVGDVVKKSDCVAMVSSIIDDPRLDAVLTKIEDQIEVLTTLMETTKSKIASLKGKKQ